eukprot:m.64737 g.64737  ORF g.64737 m.64737 type:complete len:117 (-) comp11503_c3_seq1:1015-1365(-)
MQCTQLLSIDETVAVDDIVVAVGVDIAVADNIADNIAVVGSGVVVVADNIEVDGNIGAADMADKTVEGRQAGVDTDAVDIVVIVGDSGAALGVGIFFAALSQPPHPYARIWTCSAG